MAEKIPMECLECGNTGNPMTGRSLHEIGCKLDVSNYGAKMKYEALYRLVNEKGQMIIRLADYPSKIVVPEIGYVVAWSEDVSQFARDDTPEFDRQVDYLIKLDAEAGVRFGMFVKHNDTDRIFVTAVDVFKSKLFALGVAYGTGASFIYSLKTKTKIYL